MRNYAARQILMNTPHGWRWIPTDWLIESGFVSPDEVLSDELQLDGEYSDTSCMNCGDTLCNCEEEE